MAKNPFRYFKTSPEIIQLGVMMYVRFPLSLRNFEDLLHDRCIDVCHESVRLWVDRFGTWSRQLALMSRGFWAGH
ncbi:ISHne6, transposase [Hyphomonas oceanitis SCH89]|uniref:ISHne6, transposase n=1 Tax=Hyphomonas oceanitis SCH89 TaxID=1280953 RepID=A0A059GBV2_9PROT|nr:ISHne6, transposase [Hyphomonas oceanitis SCH89]